MTKKQKLSPKTKHKPFSSFSTRLQDNDWMIGVYNPNDQTACYFLAEPTLPNKNSAPQMKATEHKHGGYVVSALNRQGLAESLFCGLPRKFKAVEDAMEWLESQIEGYIGDEALPEFDQQAEAYTKSANVEIGEKIHEDMEYAASMSNFVNQVEYFAKESVKNPGKAGAVTGRTIKNNAARAKKAKETKGKNGEKSVKAMNQDAPYVKPMPKFKTSKEELKSLGLDGLFND